MVVSQIKDSSPILRNHATNRNLLFELALRAGVFQAIPSGCNPWVNWKLLEAAWASMQQKRAG